MLICHKNSFGKSSMRTPSQRAFNPQKISWWLHGSTWVFSSFIPFIYNFMHNFSYMKKSVDCYFVNKVYTDILRFLWVHRNSKFIEGWTLLTETIVLIWVQGLSWQFRIAYCCQAWRPTFDLFGSYPHRIQPFVG